MQMKHEVLVGALTKIEEVFKCQGFFFRRAVLYSLSRFLSSVYHYMDTGWAQSCTGTTDLCSAFLIFVCLIPAEITIKRMLTKVHCEQCAQPAAIRWSLVDKDYLCLT